MTVESALVAITIAVTMALWAAFASRLLIRRAVGLLDMCLASTLFGFTVASSAFLGLISLTSGLAAVCTQAATFLVLAANRQAMGKELHESSGTRRLWQVATAGILITASALTLWSTQAYPVIGLSGFSVNPVVDQPQVMAARYLVHGVALFLLAGANATLAYSLVARTSGSVRQAWCLLGGASTIVAVLSLVWAAQGIVGPTDVPGTLASIAAAGIPLVGVLILTAFLRVGGWRVIAGRYRDLRAIRRLAPLWEQVCIVKPSVSLLGFPDGAARLGAQERRFALIRVMIEIREWLLILGRRLPPDSFLLAQEIAATEGVPTRHRFHVAAQACILAALVTPEPSPPTPSRMPVGRDLDEELALLLSIAPRANDGTSVRVAERLLRASRTAAGDTRC